MLWRSPSAGDWASPPVRAAGTRTVRRRHAKQGSDSTPPEQLRTAKPLAELQGHGGLSLTIGLAERDPPTTSPSASCTSELKYQAGKLG